MAYAIERRLKWDLFAYLIVSDDYYEDIARYQPRPDRDYRPFVESLLPVGWKVTKEGIWYNITPESVEIPEQGFKIHISATSPTATETLRRVVPPCAEAGVPFKVLLDGFLLDFTNSKNYSRSSSGKFVTIYPRDTDQCGELLSQLHEATSDLEGPYILTDRPYRDSRVVFYRYGSFHSSFQLNLFGEQLPIMRGRNGDWVPDSRPPYFELPEGVTDPFCNPMEEHEGTVYLAGRYAIGGSLRFSNSGGVYEGEDVEAGAPVIVKEARPFVNTIEGGTGDAVATLKKEAKVLQALAETPFVPRFIDLFQEWQHHYLVEEHLDGLLLSSYRALDDVGLLLQRPVTEEAIDRFCRSFGQLGLNLLEVVEAFHTRGILIGDLSPSNILVDPDSLEVKLIDFEGAFIQGEVVSQLDSTVTTGFVSPRRLGGELPGCEDDLYSLASVLYSVLLPVQEFFPIHPAARDRFLKAVARDYDLPPEVGDAVFALLDGDRERARDALGRLVEPSDRPWRPKLHDPPRVGDAEIREVVRGIRDYILWSADPTRNDRLWPSDYRLFTTNPLTVGYGALGTALFLHQVDGEVPDFARTWIDSHTPDHDSYPPGLFVGLSGVAWALAELGDVDRAVEVMDLASESPLLWEGWDLFFGATGFGLANLYLWSRTGEGRFLERAVEAADWVLARAQSDDQGLYWLNSGDIHYYGYGHGGSGVAFFLLKLYQATGAADHLRNGRSALDYEIAQAIDKGDFVVWERSAGDNMRAPYWRYGTAGIGSVLVRYGLEVGEDRYLDLAARAARYVSTKYAVFPSLFVGLAGMGEFLLDMHWLTGEPEFADEARRLTEGILLYRIDTPHGVAFPGEELIRICTDYGTGSAGIGLFFSRLLEPGPRLFFDFDLPGTDTAG